MNKQVKEFVKLVTEKTNEVVSDYNAMKTNESVSKATRNNRLYHFGRDKKTLRLINDLLKLLPDDVKLTDEMVETLTTLTTLKSERKVYTVEVAVGDKILDLMSKYDGVRDLLNKVNKAAERINAHVDFTKGEIVSNE